jgi:hypothetical protein
MVGAAGNRADLAELGAVLAPIKHAMRRLPPCMTATAHDACAISGRDEETARLNQTKKHRLQGTSRICTPGLSQPEKDIANPGAVHIRPCENRIATDSGTAHGALESHHDAHHRP